MTALRVPRLSDPSKFVDVVLTDIRLVDGHVSRFRFDDKVLDNTVPVISGPSCLEERRLSDEAFLAKYDLDMKNAIWPGYEPKSPPKLLATTDLRIVSMITFADKIYLATEHSVFVHDPTKSDLDFLQMHLVEIPMETQ